MLKKQKKQLQSIVSNLQGLYMIPKKTYKVKEIFYSLQGEGARQGEASIFIRFALCNKNCWYCDTDWSAGTDMSLEGIYNEIFDYPCDWIVLTGGEPTLQVDKKFISYFHSLGFKIAIETNGTNKVLDGIDYITCSPKVEPDTLRRNFLKGVDEFRYAIDIDTDIPSIRDLPYAKNYYISPMFMGEEHKRYDMNDDNIQYCINFIKNHPEWKLSLQVHKIINIR